MKTLLLAILGLVLISAFVDGKIIGTKVFMADWPMSTYQVFWYKDQLHATFDVNNANSTETEPKVVRFSDTGVIEASVSIPITCMVLYCTTEVAKIVVQGNHLVLLAQSDGCCSDYHWIISTIDLDTFEIISNIDGKYFSGWGPTGLIASATPGVVWVPMGKITTSATAWSVLKIGSSQLSPVTPVATSGPVNDGFVNPVDPNSLFVCAGPGGNAAFYKVDMKTLQSTSAQAPCFMSDGGMLIPGSKMFASAYNMGGDSISINVWEATSNALELTGINITLAEQEELGAFACSAEYCFVGTVCGYQNTTGKLYQVAFSGSQFTLVDQVELPKVMGFPLFNPLDDYEYAMNPNTNQLALAMIRSWEHWGIIVVDFDGN